MADSARQTDASVVGVNSDDAEDLIGALSSDTARQILDSLHESPSTPSEVAEAVDTTLQNARYHLGNLEDAELISVHDTRYSPKGREMKVYAPEKPTVVFVGGDDEGDRLRDLLTEAFAGLLGLGVVAAGVEYLYRAYAPEPQAAPTAGGDGGDDAGFAMEQADGGAPTEDAADAASDGAPEIVEMAIEAATPGVLVFLGGAVVLLSFLLLRYGRGDG